MSDIDKDLLKKIESLEKRIKTVESNKKENVSMFGRSYSLTGSSNSDYIIQTKGQVKILWGNKFIDLIKNGKINVDTTFIFSVKSKNEITNKDGIYITEDGFVYLKVGSNEPISLIGEIGTTFVSFMEGQESTSNNKYNALLNIGLIYKTIDDVGENSLKNGIIYIESELKLYLIKDGMLSQYSMSIPNPFTNLFVIQKTDESIGALVIKGEKLQNSLYFDSFQIYSDSKNAVINSDNSLIIKIDNDNILTIDDKSVKIEKELIVDTIKSNDDRFKLHFINGESVLEVDKIIQNNEFESYIFPEYWFLNNLIIKKIIKLEETSEETSEIFKYNISFYLTHSYKVGDILYIYKALEEDTLEFKVLELINEKNEIICECGNSLDNNELNNFIGKYIFLIKSIDNELPLRLKDNNLDIVEYNENKDCTIKTRIGNLSEIEGGENSSKYFGIYTNNLILDGNAESNFPRYTDTLNSILLETDILNLNSYNNVLLSVGSFKLIFKEYNNTISELKSRIEQMEIEINLIKEQLN